MIAAALLGFFYSYFCMLFCFHCRFPKADADTDRAGRIFLHIVDEGKAVKFFRLAFHDRAGGKDKKVALRHSENGALYLLGKNMDILCHRQGFQGHLVFIG